MSRPVLPIPPVLAFASRDGETWGVAAGGDPALVALGHPDADGPVQVETGRLGRGASRRWEMRRNGDELVAVEQPADVAAAGADPGLNLVRISEPGEGAGLAYAGRPEAPVDSARLVFAWFPEERAVGLVSIRPDRARGQDRDELSVSCLGEAAQNQVFDPRLSSTYGGDGLLRRVGVELWLGESEDADLHSLRLAGETTGAVARLDVDGARIQAQPFLAHSRGQSGIGVYVLITRP